jgi:Ca2+-binding EF-hand superfamily protein
MQLRARQIGQGFVLSLLAMAVPSPAGEATTNREPAIRVSPLSAVAVKARVKDADKDGKISTGEFLGETPPEIHGPLTAMFKAADKDQDGSLSPEELEGLGSGSATNSDSAVPAVRKVELSTEDADGDGRISLAEFTSDAKGDQYNTTMLQGLFRSQDKDGDGFLSAEELQDLPGRSQRLKKGTRTTP